MVDLRWAISEHTTAQTPRLQYRQCPPVVSLGAPAGWTEWMDVPFVVVPQVQRQIIDGVWAVQLGAADEAHNGGEPSAAEGKAAP